MKKSTFLETINTRGLEQLQFAYDRLLTHMPARLAREYAEIGDLVAIHGSLIEATLSMYWAD